MRTILDERYASKPCQLLDWYLPDENGFDTIIWFHGGGMEAGDRKAGAELAKHAVSAGYALYPWNTACTLRRGGRSSSWTRRRAWRG